MAQSNKKTTAASRLQSQWIDAFRAGTQTDSGGHTHNWTHSDLDQIVNNYNANDPAPAVIGHPQNDAPAYGWINGVRRVGDILQVKLTQVEKKFAKLVETGRFKQRSIAINNSGNGYTLRHIGFLGAAAPAIRGLKQIQFNNEGEFSTYEFADEETVGFMRSVARLMRHMRELFIADQGIETADKLIPEHLVASTEIQAGRQQQRLHDEEAAADAPSDEIQLPKPLRSYTTTEETMTDKLQFTQADIDAAAERARTEAEAEIENERAEFAAAQRRARDVEIDATLKQLTDDGKMVPAQQTGLRELMATLDDTKQHTFNAVVDGKSVEQKKTQYQMFTNYLNGLPASFKNLQQEAGGSDTDPRGNDAAQFNAPAGYAIDPDRAALDQQIRSYQQAHKTTYAEAATAVTG